jgi:hypothetical protein
MSKISKRKSTVLVGNRIDTAYEMQKNNRLQALKTAENTPDEIKNSNVKFLVKGYGTISKAKN